ncbi:MAG TPA: nuclear transport factor 2 family protein [Bryobacteraceae bacterium]|jgi:ketosteroid isomerase-like protein|nr:nuclear transport factor 2 family protein [Bryobacteraceae bacterium]
MPNIAEEIIAMERAALDRWGRGDPQGYLEIDAPDITYFDPAVEKRIDGLPAMRHYLAPFAGRIQIDHYDMIDPRVQHHGEVAVLTFNLITYSNPETGNSLLARWNATEVYARLDGKWRIVHNHWSYIKPELKTSVGEYAGG